jgi:CRISPR system Cascade subunit CasD
MNERRTLLIRLDGPMQAWGVDSRFSLRETRPEPSKSGVVGLVAAALGREREADVSDLAALAFGVRVDREGRLRRDFHTAGAYARDASGRVMGGYYKAEGSKSKEKEAVVSERFYLSDACFTAGLEGEDASFLEHLRRKLLDPHWPLFLGRRAFPPAAPLALGLVEMPLVEALQRAPLPERHDDAGALRFILDADTALPAGVEARHVLAGPDTPVTFRPRRHLTRSSVMLRLPAGGASSSGP